MAQCTSNVGSDDARHTLRRVHQLILSDAGINVGGVKITAPIIRLHLQESGFNDRAINSLLDASDRQNTIAALSLLATLQALGDPAPGSTHAFCVIREALRTLGGLGTTNPS
ncbi:hypothetical protein C8F04DRAFT_1391169, partial [Mycena alexandri]